MRNIAVVAVLAREKQLERRKATAPEAHRKSQRRRNTVTQDAASRGLKKKMPKIAAGKAEFIARVNDSTEKHGTHAGGWSVRISKHLAKERVEYATRGLCSFLTDATTYLGRSLS